MLANSIMNNLKNHLLISTPHMNDEVFGKSVIYICEHNLEGAMGLIINKPIDDIRFNRLEDLDQISNEQFENTKIEFYFGGPVLVEKTIVLHTNELKNKTTVPISNKISVSSVKHSINDLEKNINANYKLFFGHSGWKPGQLESEIENGDWLLQSSKMDLLFNIPSEKIWEHAAKSLGINIFDISNIGGAA